MTTQYRYGNLEPDGNVPKASVDAFETVRSLFDKWRSDHLFLESGGLQEDAQEIANAYPDLFDELTESQRRQLVESIRGPSVRISGHPYYLLDALFYVSQAPVLTGKFRMYSIGRNLPKHKSIIIEQGSRIVDLGRESEGVIINRSSNPAMLGINQSGIIVNYEDVRGARHSGSGVLLNFSSYSKKTLRGSQLTFTSEIRSDLSEQDVLIQRTGIAPRLLQINSHFPEGLYANQIPQKTHDQLVTYLSPPGGRPYSDPSIEHAIEVISQNLPSLVDPLMFENRMDDPNLISDLRAYDWDGYRTMLNDIATEIGVGD